MFRYLAAGLLALTLLACSSPTGLAPGLVARMDEPGAKLDREAALSMLNGFRASRNVPGFAADAGLDNQAQALAVAYAANGNAPKPPAGIVAMMTSGGYPTFAETFSGWRATAKDAGTLADPSATRAGLGVVYDPGSAFGVYWVLLLAAAN